MPLHSITFGNDNWGKRLATGPRTFTFPAQGVTVLCGPNGTGKSTILASIKDGPIKPGHSFVFAEVNKTDDVGVIKFDFERDSPRSDPGTFGGMAARHKSHGQISGQVLTALTDGLAVVPETKPLLFVFDEPEQAFDVDGLERLHAWLMTLANRPRTQVIIATHSPFLILEPTFHVIEMVPGYQAKVQEHVRRIRT